MNENPNNLPRIAASSYLNSAPLIWSFLYGSRRTDVQLIRDAAPAVCADMLASGNVQAALVPVIEYQRVPGLTVVPRVCIASQSRVRSVVLVAREGIGDLRDVRKVALDISSRTSAALIQIVFREFVGSEPQWTTSAPDVRAMLSDNDAALIIGDPGMTFARQGLIAFDLAELWHRYTGFGFVFAMWMVRQDYAEAVSRINFTSARDEGLAHVDEIVAHYRDAVGLTPTDIRSYLLENISYELDPELTKGLDLFYKLAHKHGLVDEITPLRLMSA